MPYAVIAEWAEGGRDTRNYDETTRLMNFDDDPPSGLIVHTSGATPEGHFRIFGVWETREAFETFKAERLDPAIEAVLSALPPDRLAEARPPVMSIYELHHLVVPTPATLGR